MLSLIRKTKAQPKPLNWYHAASPEDRQEYDAFGPWIYEIGSEADMPPRFRPFYAEHQSARFLLKIPTKGERREMRPGMDLYVAVLAVHDHGVCLMQLSEDTIVTRSVIWEQIGAIDLFKDLLIGRWSLLLTDGDRMELAFSSVSLDLINKITEFVRTRCIQTPLVDHQPDSQATPDPDPDQDQTKAITDMFFRSALSALKHRGPKPVHPIHFEPQNQSCRDEKNRRRRTTGLLILSMPDELVLINRASPTRKRFQACYAAQKIFVPYNRITGYSLHAPIEKKPRRFYDFALHLDQQIVSQPCLAIPEAVITMLDARHVPHQQA